MDIRKFNYPLSDFEAWVRYPRLQWMYSTSALLDVQKIKWLPYYKSGFVAAPMSFYNDVAFTQPFAKESNTGYIFVDSKYKGHTAITTEVAVNKGNVLNIMHHDGSDLQGTIDIRICAFVKLYMMKFNGIISVDTIDSDIFSVHLKPSIHMLNNHTEFSKVFTKLYRRITLSK